MVHLRMDSQHRTLTYLARTAYVIAAIEIAVNIAPTKLTIGLVGAALVLALYDVSCNLKTWLSAVIDRYAARIEEAIKRHAAVVEANGLQHRETIKQATEAHVSALGDKVVNAERVAERAAVGAGLAVVQGYLNAARDGNSTQPIRVVR
ncbi:hypothetical protein ACIBCT_20670 [Streptosporangium sp. NPDC050855]|uniref:hypothetical protein n=1 Tax=Streptosporangium sp. NPDC050855 TaxID=3366194 RepID=UPI0037B9D723